MTAPVEGTKILLHQIPDGVMVTIKGIMLWLNMSRSTFFRLKAQGTAPLKLVPCGGGKKGAPAEQVRAWYLGLGR